MKIALLGYGRMGKTIEKLTKAEKHDIVYKTSEPIDHNKLRQADVAIDFSVAEAAFSNITACFEENIPIVCGTTGWLDQYDQAVIECQKHEGSFLYASNFSIGVNLFFQFNKTLAKMMGNFEEYKLSIEEIHHIKKRDKPSGTAISLAEDIMANSKNTKWSLIENNKKSVPEHTIPITSKRFEDVKGTHIIKYSSSIDAIEIKHTAFSRDGFAKGALIAAEYICDKKGVFDMKEVIKNLI